MMIKNRLQKASLNYLNQDKDKPKYSEVDIITYRQKIGLTIKRRTSLLKIGLGAILSAVGLITLPLPTGSIFLIGFGCSLMVKGGFWDYYKDAKKKTTPLFWKVGLR